MLRPTHYLALWVATGELIASVPISQHLQFHRDALTHLLHDPAAYDDGILAVYSVALTDDPDDMPPPGFDSVYAGPGLPDGYAAAWNPHDPSAHATGVASVEAMLAVRGADRSATAW